MPISESALANIPGLGGILAARQFNQETSARDMQQQLGQVGLLAKIQQMQTQQAALQRSEKLRALLAQSGGDMEKVLPMLMSSGPEGIALASHLAPLIKQQREAKLMAGVNPEQMTPDQLDTLGVRLSLGGHAGGTGLLATSDRRRALEQNRAGITAMAGAPEQPAEVLSPDIAGPARPATPGQPGMVDFLLDSPHVGPAAKAFKSFLDRGAPGMTPQQAQTYIGQLNAKHVSGEQAKTAREEMQENRLAQIDAAIAGRPPKEPKEPKEPTPGVYTLPNGSRVSHAQIMSEYRLENKLMDELDLRILDKTDPTRAAAERDKVRNATPFPQWAKQQFGVDVRGGANAAPEPVKPTVAAPVKPLPMPKNKADLKTGITYDTTRGKGKWNGTVFEAVVD